MPTYRQLSRTANEIRFADPSALFNTVSIKVAVQPKKAGSTSVYNSNSAINIQRTVSLPLPEGCKDKCVPLNQERLSLRFSLSGSTASQDAVKSLISDFQAVLVKVQDDLIAGFLPEALSVELASEA